MRCGDCARTIVLDEDNIQVLYRLVIQRASAILDSMVTRMPTLQIVEPAELLEVRCRHSNETSPLGAKGQHVLGFFEQLGHQRTIYIERGLPRATFIGTLAHEYAHAWQADYAPPQQDLLRREGFAEWLAYRILITLGHTREAARATRREDEYGQGLRYFIALEQQTSSKSVLIEARTGKGA